MSNIKISDLTEGTAVDPANDWFVYVDSSDPTQDPLTGTTKKIRLNSIPASNKATEEMKRISFIRS